jgi:hypothetical protein
MVSGLLPALGQSPAAAFDKDKTLLARPILKLHLANHKKTLSVFLGGSTAISFRRIAFFLN